MRLKKLLGYVWALPLTLLGLTCALPFIVLGVYHWDGLCGDALVWYYDWKQGPRWLWRLWRDWQPLAFGQVVITVYEPYGLVGGLLLLKANRSIEQQMKWGILYPLVYLLRKARQGGTPHRE